MSILMWQLYAWLSLKSGGALSYHSTYYIYKKLYALHLYKICVAFLKFDVIPLYSFFFFFFFFSILLVSTYVGH